MMPVTQTTFIPEQWTLVVKIGDEAFSESVDASVWASVEYEVQTRKSDSLFAGLFGQTHPGWRRTTIKKGK